MKITIGNPDEVDSAYVIIATGDDRSGACIEPVLAPVDLHIKDSYGRELGCGLSLAEAKVLAHSLMAVAKVIEDEHPALFGTTVVEDEAEDEVA